MGGKLVRIELPPEAPLEALAAALLREADGPAGLAAHTVLLPHMGLSGPLVSAIGEAAEGPCPLPQILTMTDWLARQPAPPVTLGEAQLVAVLHRQLADRSWLAEADHWALATELAGLFEALGRGLGQFPNTPEALTDLLSRAHQTRSSALLRGDAQLVHALWYACEGRPEWGLSRWQRDGLAMSHLLHHPAGPLWFVDPARATPQVAAFLTRYAERTPVRVAVFDAMAGARSAWVAAACLDDASALLERARAWAALHPQPPTGIRLHRALGREGEVRHVCDTVCDWLSAGLQSIAVVATDRALARRLRAMLERRGVLAEDTAGWSLATTRVGAAVRDLLRLQSRPSAALLHACIDSPLVAVDQRDPLLRVLVPALVKLPPHARLDWDALLGSFAADADVYAWLTDLRSALHVMGARPRPLAAWADALLTALQTIAPHLQLDAVGRQLLALVRESGAALAGDASLCSRRDLTGWLDWTLENALFRDASVQSQVLLTHQAALRGLCFDAVVVAGADAAHLPAVASRPRIIRDAARAELGLPDAAARRRQAVEDWCLLVGSAPRVEICWQALDDRGEPNVASPLVQLMQGFHTLAWGRPLPDAASFSRVRPASPSSLRPAEMAVMATQLQVLSSTAYDVLLKCPYHWFVRTGLALKSPLEVSESIGSRDYGVAIHDILRDFHRAVPVVSSVGRDAALADLDAAAVRVFAPIIARDFAASAWLERWRAVAPAYIDWQTAREAQGWRVDVAVCEAPVRRPLPLDAGAVQLHGKPDRVDTHVDAGVGRSVIDYKTGTRKGSDRLATDPTEDAQLVLYAHLLEQVTAVAYVPLGSDALKKDMLKAVELSGPRLSMVVAGHLQRLADTLSRVAAGEALRALGDDEACRTCHANGVCRRDHRAAVAKAI